MRRFYADFVAPGSICFDVGANVGDRVEVFLELGARVVAVEPQRSCVAELDVRFGADARLEVVPEAVGEAVGTARIYPSEAHTVSSMSREWIDRVRESGRFADVEWGEPEEVPVTTLDALIDAFGRPDFIKIDVEGYEPRVIAGLSRPVPALSFEFVPEIYWLAEEALDGLVRLGSPLLNLSFGESMELAGPWLEPGPFASRLEEARRTGQFADIYVRFPDG